MSNSSPIPKIVSVSLLAAAATMASASPCIAQVDAQQQSQQFGSDVAESDLEPATDDEIHFTFGGGFTHRFETDIDSGGEFSVDTLSAGLDVAAQLSRETSLTVRTNIGVAAYDFGGIPAAIEPWDDVHTLAFGAVLAHEMNDEWSVFGGPVFQFSRESGADWGDAFTAGGVGGLTWRANDDLLIGAGAGIMSQIEDDVRIFPIIIVEWQLTQKWRVSSRGPSGGRTSVEFAGIELIWQASDAWEFALGGGSSFSRFRLDDDGDGLAPDGVGQDEYMPVWLRASWHPSARCSIDAIAGFAFGGELSLDDESGDGIASTDYDQAPFIGLFGSIRF